MYIMYIPSTNFEKKKKRKKGKTGDLIVLCPNLVSAIFSSHPDWPVLKYIFQKSLSL